MTSTPQAEPADQFLSIEATALLLGMDPGILRQGIACGLVPIRRDNQGALRIHRVEVPDDLQEQISHSEPDPRLHAESLVDEVRTLREQLEAASSERGRLEALLEQQARALERSAALLDASETDTARLSALLERSSNLMSDADKKLSIASNQTAQLALTTDNAMHLLERAVGDAEAARADVDRLAAIVDRTVAASDRVEGELDQRNKVIDKQHELMQRLVTLGERSARSPASHVKRRRSFWQRLWGGGKGI